MIEFLFDTFMYLGLFMLQCVILGMTVNLIIMPEKKLEFHHCMSLIVALHAILRLQSCMT